MKPIDREAILDELAKLRTPGGALQDFSSSARSWSDENIELGSVVQVTFPKDYSIEHILARESFMAGEWADKFLKGTPENYVENRMILKPIDPDEAVARMLIIASTNNINAPIEIPDPSEILSSYMIIYTPNDQKLFYETQDNYKIVKFIND